MYLQCISPVSINELSNSRLDITARGSHDGENTILVFGRKEKVNLIDLGSITNLRKQDKENNSTISQILDSMGAVPFYMVRLDTVNYKG